MLRLVLSLLVGVLAWRVTFCYIKCPDGHMCPDLSTCCMSTRGYSCCLYPKAVCCSDLEHCCPSGYRCNKVTRMCEKQGQPWLTVPMVRKEPAEEESGLDVSGTPLQQLKEETIPELKKSSVVYCDNYYTCPDGTTCCRHPKGAWFCCPYSPGRCCLDGFHCCPYGYDCDWSYQHCVRTGLPFPFAPKQALSSVPATPVSHPEDKSSMQEMRKTLTPMTALTEARSATDTSEDGVIRCDGSFYCPAGSACCKGTSGQWNCCPYPLGQCCSDGIHCCEYGYTCDATSLSCRTWYSQVPSRQQEDALRKD